MDEYNNIYALSKIPEQELYKHRPSTFKSLGLTQNHKFVVDHIFQCHLKSENHSYTARNTETCPVLPVMRELQMEMDAWYINYLGELSEAQILETIQFEFVGGGQGEMSRCEIMQHLVTHNSYHNGQLLRSRV